MSNATCAKRAHNSAGHLISQLRLRRPQPRARRVRENICYGFTPGDANHPSDADVELACRRAAVWDDVQAWPKGLGTKLGEWMSDVEPSGGQKQRLVIARAIVRDPAMLLFDESTAALDSHAEGSVKEAIELAMKGRTRLIIAHRLATVVSSDLILVVDDGRVVEAGTPGELRKHTEGHYFQILRAQLDPLLSEGGPVAAAARALSGGAGAAPSAADGAGAGGVRARK